MKRFFTLAATLIGCAALLGACKEKEDDPSNYRVWDFAPIQLAVMATNAEGEDLLDPAMDNNILSEDICLQYNDKEYHLGLGAASAVAEHTRYYMPNFYAIKLTRNDKGYMLMIGEFDGQKSIEKEMMILRWADGTAEHIGFSNDVKWKNDEPDVDRHFYHNGIEIASPLITIVK